MKWCRCNLCLAVLITVFCAATAFANDCNLCKRLAVMGKCENKALPANFWSEQKKFEECLRNEFDLKEGESFFEDPENPSEKWIRANKKCGHLLKPYDRKFSWASPEMMQSSLQAWIASILTCDRFHMQNRQIVDAYRKQMNLSGLPVKEDKSRLAGYFFEATYDCAKTAVYNDDNEPRFPSYLNIRLYYDGTEKELVKEWTVNSPHHSWHSLTNRMFKNRGSAWHRPALMRQSVPITEILDAFEKVPVSCSIHPDKVPIPYNGEMTIELDTFRDGKGNPSRDFNRVLVTVESGEINNGVRPEGWKKKNAAVFQVGSGKIKVNYTAPDTGIHPYEVIRVFHCHTIVKPSSLALKKTEISGKEIAAERVMFKFPGVTAVLKAQKKVKRREDRNDAKQQVHHHWDELQAASVLFELENTPRLSKQIRENTGKLAVKRYRYPVKKISLMTLTHNGTGNIETDISGVRISKKSRLSAGQAVVALENPGDMVKMDVDPATGKIVKVYLPGVIIRYKKSLKTVGTRTAGENTDPIDRSFDEDVAWRISQDFGDDGTKSIYLVKGGDGKRYLAGGVEKHKQWRYSREDKKSSWTVSIQTE